MSDRPAQFAAALLAAVPPDHAEVVGTMLNALNMCLEPDTHGLVLAALVAEALFLAAAHDAEGSARRLLEACSLPAHTVCSAALVAVRREHVCTALAIAEFLPLELLAHVRDLAAAVELDEVVAVLE